MMNAWKGFVACALAASLALCLCACGGSDAQAGGSGASSASAASSSASASSSTASSSASASSSAASSSASASSSAAESASSSAAEASASSSSAASGAEGFDFVDECTDEHGNVTLYALTELKGWQLATLLDQQGYVWNEGDSTWTRESDGASFAAQKETGTYTIDDYNAANEKGGGIIGAGFLVVGGYSDVASALNGAARCVVEDSYVDANGLGMAVIYGPSMKEYMVIASPNGNNSVGFMILSKEAVGSGFADQLLGTETGGTFQAMWQSVTHEETYGN